GERTLSTTVRPSAVSVAANTRDIPPRGSSRSIRYASPRDAWSDSRMSFIGYGQRGANVFWSRGRQCRSPGPLSTESGHFVRQSTGNMSDHAGAGRSAFLVFVLALEGRHDAR